MRTRLLLAALPAAGALLVAVLPFGAGTAEAANNTRSVLLKPSVVTASSENRGTGQLAVKAVDGSSAGYPGDYSREWATVNGRAKSWLRLSWPNPIVVSKIVINDRPNSSDRITKSSVYFSDGSRMTTGSLSNNGAAKTLIVPQKTTSSLLFSVDAVSASTSNVGLAEIQVFGRVAMNTVPPAPAPIPTPTATPTPTPTVTPAPTPTPTPVPTAGTSVLSFGAVGDGTTDDTAALQQALAALRAGDVLIVPAEKTFRHTDVLTVRTNGVRITGGGTLLATNEARSAFTVDADDVTVDHLTFRAVTTHRGERFEEMKVRLAPRSGTVLDSVAVDGAAAAGIYVGGATGFTLTDVSVANTRADAIHLTGGSTGGTIVRPVIRNAGDDGIAVVSYARDGRITSDISVTSPRFYGQIHGRGFSVVGGADIVFSDVYAERSSAAAIYIASESSYDTFGVARVTVDGGTLTGSNQGKEDHGAVIIYDSTSRAITDVTIKNLTIVDTRDSATDNVRFIADGANHTSRVSLVNVAITGGPRSAFGGNGPSSVINRTGWTQNGTSLTDWRNWS